MAEILRITGLGAQGDGIAEDGRYVAHALPGEEVRVTPSGDRARLDAVLSAAPERVDPGCPHVRDCGGCVLQHAADWFVADWKAGLVRTALAARGIEAAPLRPMVTVPPGARRRITVAGRRGKTGTLLGFHAPASERVVGISACLVAAPELIDALPALAPLVELGASRKGEIRITLTASAAGIDAAVTGAKTLTGPETALLAGHAARANLARLAWNGEIALTRAPPEQIMGRARVVPPPGGFLQPTREGEVALVAAVAEAVGPAARIADLFAGAGTFALPLSERAEIHAVEAETAALAALEAGWRKAAPTEGLRRVSTETRDLHARPLRPAELKGIDAVVIDPPRAGARAQAEALATSSVARVAAVSCNPATFARDARILIDGGYRLDWVQPVDQFRWSAHLELVAAFRR